MTYPVVTTRGYGNPRREAGRINEWAAQAAMYSQMPDRAQDDVPHHMPPAHITRMADRFETFLPKMASTGGWGAAQSFFDGLLPHNATLSPNAGSGYAHSMSKSMGRSATSFGLPGGDFGGGNVMQQPQRPYLPEFDSQDRQSFPNGRQQANMYWRMFSKMDPVIGQCLEMYSQLCWGNYMLGGEGVDGEIKTQLERMDEITRLRSKLPYFVSEYLTVGEAAPHLYYSETDGIWTHLALHNPDFLDVIYVPSIKMDPIVQFRPDPKLRQLLTSNHPSAADVRATMPAEIQAAFASGQPIPLFPSNFTLIARRLHPYDIRGTSILSRMWRALMYEDGIFNASLATARRHAGPIKVAKIGDPASGTIPGPAVRDELLRVLAQCEVDPHAWLVWHYGINFDLVGSTDRMMSIDKSWEIVERIKLVAMGVNKAFLTGEVTYASAASGLSIFLRKLKSMRQFFEQEWIIPKYYRQVAVMNGWIKRTPAELAHNVRVVRSQRELEDMNAYIVPKIEWEESLNPTVDQQMINAMRELDGLNVQFSAQTLNTIVGRDWEKELRQRGREAKRRQEIMAEFPELQKEIADAAMADGGGGPGGGGGGGGMLPGLGPDVFGGPEADGAPEGDLGGPEMGPPGLGEGAAVGEDGASADGARPARGDAWTADEIADLQSVLRGRPPEVEPWASMVDEVGQPKSWRVIEDWLVDRQYPEALVSDLQALLRHASGQGRRGSVRRPAGLSQRALLERASNRLLDRPREFEHPDYVLGIGNGVSDARPRGRPRRR